MFQPLSILIPMSQCNANYQFPSIRNRLMKKLLCACLPVLLSMSYGPGAEKPNILLILADDMGYGDLNCTGSRLLKTPHIDALRNAGVLCRQAYVTSPVCSP